MIARPVWAFMPLAGALLPVSGCNRSESSDPAGVTTMTITLTSTAFREGETIPRTYTADGENVSPPLQWGDPPAGTQAFALIADDPDAPRGTWVHWVLVDLAPGERGLGQGVPAAESVPAGGKPGKNDFGKLGYGGPSPPPGKPHRYFFKLYALDRPLALPPGATRAQVEAAMKGHVLAEGRLMGKYGR
jgi:Raf kinase inhibitor-like YbhB/YbcL family protein